MGWKKKERKKKEFFIVSHKRSTIQTPTQWGPNKYSTGHLLVLSTSYTVIKRATIRTGRDLEELQKYGSLYTEDSAERTHSHVRSSLDQIFSSSLQYSTRYLVYHLLGSCTAALMLQHSPTKGRDCTSAATTAKQQSNSRTEHRRRASQSKQYTWWKWCLFTTGCACEAYWKTIVWYII